jgi:hypothetical protein
MNQSIQSHADRLAAAAATTAAARSHVDDHAALAAEVDRLKTLAGEGELDDAGAADLLRKAEALRLAAIVQPRRQRALDDATKAEVAVGLEVLAALSDALAPLEADAEAAADLLTAALIDPAAAKLEDDIVLARELGVARCWVEKAMPGVYGASVLRERLKAAGQVTWGSAHVPVEADLIVATFDADAKAIRDSINGLLAVHKMAVKNFR